MGKVDPSGLEEPGRRAGQTVGARNTLLSDRCYAKPDWNGCDKDYTKGRLYKIGSRIYWHEFRNRFFKPKYVGKSVLLGTKKKFGMVELSTRLGGGHAPMSAFFKALEHGEGLAVQDVVDGVRSPGQRKDCSRDLRHERKAVVVFRQPSSTLAAGHDSFALLLLEDTARSGDTGKAA